MRPPPPGCPKTLGSGCPVTQGHIPYEQWPRATLSHKCTNLYTCRLDCDIPAIQTEALEMPLAAGVSLAVQVSFFLGILLSVYLLFCLVYFGASCHLENGIESIYEVDAPMYCHPKDYSSLEWWPAEETYSWKWLGVGVGCIHHMDTVLFLVKEKCSLFGQ